MDSQPPHDQAWSAVGFKRLLHTIGLFLTRIQLHTGG